MEWNQSQSCRIIFPDSFPVEIREIPKQPDTYIE